MESIGGLLKHPRKPPKKARKTEKGELYDYFLSYLNPDRAKGGYLPISHSRLAYLLQGLNLQDLYAMRSMFKDRVERNGVAAACKHFWWSLREDVEEQ